MLEVLSCDLGASSGRLSRQMFNGEKIDIQEISRFTNGPKKKGKNYFWDYAWLLKNIKEVVFSDLHNASSVGIDTWGVDVGFIDNKGSIISDPYSYRDEHSKAQVQKITNPYDLFRSTGNSVDSINTLFQLMAIQSSNKELLSRSSQILMMPNLLLHGISGVSVNEFSIASTSGLLNRNTKNWDGDLQRKFFQLPLPFAKIEKPHQIVANINKIKIALVPGHDTACALSALPIKSGKSVFVSLGTWALIGKEVSEAIISEKAFISGFTNEGTSEGMYRFQKNAMGFWILQKLREEWLANGEVLTFEEEKDAIKNAGHFDSLINLEDPSFFNPNNMTDAICEFCRKTNQKIPTLKGHFLKLFMNSLAASLRSNLRELSSLTQINIEEIVLGGGGVNHQELCQEIANSTGITVYTGPIESSSIGNGLSQLRALGEINSIVEGREIVKNSYRLIEYLPEKENEWKEINHKYNELIGGNLYA